MPDDSLERFGQPGHPLRSGFRDDHDDIAMLGCVAGALVHNAEDFRPALPGQLDAADDVDADIALQVAAPTE